MRHRDAPARSGCGIHGPIFTVPFNLFGAVENMSRDWVIDKIAIGVTYDSGLKKALPAGVLRSLTTPGRRSTRRRSSLRESSKSRSMANGDDLGPRQ